MSERTVLLSAVWLVLAGCGAAAYRGGSSNTYRETSGGSYYPGEPAPMAMAELKKSAGSGWKDDREDEEAAYDGDEFMDSDGVILAQKGAEGGESGIEVIDQPQEAPEPPTGEMPDAVVKGRIIIYDARIGLAVFQVQEELEKIRKKVKGWEGYMISMSADMIVFRVPVEKFDDVVDDISSIGELISKDITGLDVTDEFRDLKIKLKNALAMRERMVELLGKAKTVKESLLIEAELKRLLEEIELLKGRIKYLQESALYSKITVHLQSKESFNRPIPKLP
ncbi:MAG: DUF4349 domain-containing protein, partial [Pseudomonadota bacterium]